MKNYESLLQELLFGAKELIDQTKNINDKFDMSIRLAEQVRKVVNVNNVQIAPAIQQQVAAEPIQHGPMSKNQYESVMGYKISQAAYDEYVDIYHRQANGEELCLWLPDPDGLAPIPEGAIVTLATKENPIYKHLFEEKQEEVIKEEEVEDTIEAVVEEPVEEIELPTEEDEVLGGEVAEQVVDIADMPIEEIVEKVLAEEDNGVEIDIDSDPAKEVPSQVVIEIDDEDFDITEQFNLIKELNSYLTYEETVERASDWVEFGINKETFDLLNFIENKNAEIIQCKTYLAYYIDAMEIDSIVYYINYFASNIEEDEEGNEIYVNDELQLEFLNEDNISAFLEYVQQLQ